MNLIILKGNLTRDPELRYTPKGTPVCEFAMATNRRWKDEATGQIKDDVTFHECRCWGRSGEAVSQHFVKGRPILIHGHQAQEKWEDKATGKQRSKTLNIVDHWEFAGESRGGQAMARPAPKDGIGQTTGHETMEDVFNEGDDIPF